MAGEVTVSSKSLWLYSMPSESLLSGSMAPKSMPDSIDGVSLQVYSGLVCSSVHEPNSSSESNPWT